jgi:hypothetical protein
MATSDTERGSAAGARQCLLAFLLYAGVAAASAPELLEVRLLPAGSGFSGWSSEGLVPRTLQVPLELGDEPWGVILQLTPTHADGSWRVRVQYETSLVISDDGPHLDLVDWKHCTSEWKTAAALGPHAFELPTPDAADHDCFPSYTRQELEAAVRAQSSLDAARWLQVIRREPGEDGSSPLVVGISTVRVRIEVVREGRWVEVSTLAFQPPMGC